MTTIIAAITASRGAIGKNGDLLYHISDDLKHFKALTSGNTVVMGRKTFESLPKGALPKRRNIVLTSQSGWTAPGVETARTLEEALEMSANDPHTYIIGGGKVYAQSLKHADTLEITLIEAPEPEGADTFFPPIDPSEWEMTEMGETTIDPRSGVPYRFVTFSRKKS